MKVVLKTAAVAGLLALGATSAMAQTAASGTVNVTATVAATCTINALAAAGVLGTADFSNGGASLILTAAQTFATATGDCNTPTHVQVSSANGAATSTATAGGGYANFFDYTAAASFGGVTATLDTSTLATHVGVETMLSATGTAGPATGTLSIVVTPVGTPKLAAGVYNDVVTVTLTAQ